MVDFNRRKLNFLDYAKILTAILVVLGHILRMYTGKGLFKPLEGNQFSSLTCDYVYTFHMPLFFMISGGVFFILKRKSDRYKKMSSFVLNKTRRLILPYLCFSFLVMLTMWYIGDIKDSIWRYFLFNYIFAFGCRHLWFLLVLYVISIFFFCFESKIYTKNIFFLLFLICYYIADFFTYAFQIASILNYSIFFYLGYQAMKNFGKISIYITAKNFLLIMFFSICLFYLYLQVNINLFPKSLELVLSVLGSYMVISVSYFLEKKIKIGTTRIFQFYSYTFSIYLFHPMIIYLIFYHFRFIQMDSYLMLVGSFILSISVSILLAKIFRKLKLGFVLGEK